MSNDEPTKEQEATSQETQSQESTTEPQKAPEAKTDDKPEVKVFDEAYVKELRTEAASHRVKAAEADKKLVETQTQLKSTVQKLTSLQVCLEKGLPASFADRLKGTTLDEMRTDADTLTALIGSKVDNTHKPAPGATNQPKKEESVTDVFRKLL